MRALTLKESLLPALGAVLPELRDHAVFEGSGELLPGHTLKHLVAAFAAWPLLSAMASLRPVQNRRAARRASAHEEESVA